MDYYPAFVMNRTNAMVISKELQAHIPNKKFTNILCVVVIYLSP